MSTRSTYLLGLTVIIALLVTSLYLQFYQGIIPCPLCTLQRLTFALLGILFLLGYFLYSNRYARFFINSLCAVSSLLGVALAGRQIWLQHFPSPDNTECGVSLEYMMQVLPMNEVMQKIFAGTAECAQRGWEFLYLNMAEWALCWFIGFLMLTVYLFLKDVKSEKYR